MRLALASLVVLALAAAPAQAGVLEYVPNGEGLYYYDSPEVDAGVAHHLEIDRVGSTLRFAAPGPGIRIVPGAPCVHNWWDSWNEVRCLADQVSAVLVFLGPEPDVLTVSADVPLLACGGGGADVMTGGPGNDILDGGPGADDVRGQAGDDILITLTPLYDNWPACRTAGAPPAADRIDGGPGVDHVEGGPGPDTLLGGDGQDRLFGFAGDDRLDGGAGEDYLFGGDGDDALAGGDADDHLLGGPGDDRLDGGAGADSLGRTAYMNVAPFNDPDRFATVVEDGDDRLDGGAGDDMLTAGPGSFLMDFTDPLALLDGTETDRSLLSPHLNGADHFIGGDGDDTLEYINRDAPVRVTLDGAADDGAAGEGDNVAPDVETIWGGARGDVLVAAAHGSFLFGELGDDVLVGGPGPDTLVGGDGDERDRLTGAGGDDDLRGGPGDDEVDGGAGRDLVLGGSGDDVLAGGDGADALEGGPGADRLDGGAGDDCLYGFLRPAGADPVCRASLTPAPQVGADGDDLLRGGPGRDRLRGGPGDDLADYAALREPVVVALAGASAAGYGASADVDELAADVESVRGGRGGDTLIGNAADNLLDGGPGDDQLIGGGGTDRLGRLGSDLLDARDGEIDAVSCGSRRDVALVDELDDVIAGLADACEIADSAAPGLPAVAPVTCPVALRLPGVNRRFVLAGPTSVFWGTRVDASRCAVRVRGAPPARRWARLSGGAAVLEPRGRGARLLARLAGGRAAACDGRVVVTRRLAVRNAPAGFGTRGRTRGAAGAGASWTMVDGCRGTRVRPTRGRVTVSR